MVCGGATASVLGWLLKAVEAVDATYGIEDDGDLRIFAGLASETDDLAYLVDASTAGAIRADMDHAIVTAAVELLARAVPRVWVRLEAGGAVEGELRRSAPGRARIPVSDLALGAVTREELSRWAADYRATMSSDPRMDGFASTSDADAFVARGAAIAEMLQVDLGPGWVVEYVPEPTRPPGVRLRPKRRCRR